MRLIDADRFKENILSGLYVFCQENKEDIARAIDDEPTVDTGDSKYLEERDSDAWESGYIQGLSEQRKHGEWIKHYSKELTYLGFFEFHTYYICSQCKIVYKCIYDFCPHCGSDMREVNNEDHD